MYWVRLVGTMYWVRLVAQCIRGAERYPAVVARRQEYEMVAPLSHGVCAQIEEASLHAFQASVDITPKLPALPAH